MASNYGQASVTDRMMRAAKLDAQLYEEVERDTSATSQALTVVIIAAVASGIGTAVGQIVDRSPGGPVGGLIAGLLGAFVGWLLWSGIAYLVGTRLFGGVATYGELLRTIGFAQAPGVLYILGFIPILGGVIRLVVGIWILVASFIAMRQALDIDNGKTALTAVIGFIAYIVLWFVLFIPLGMMRAIT